MIPSFTNPWMLAGLLAVGLPILIHYLTRARPRRIAFPPYKFLQEACAGRQAVHRLRTMVLLTVRTLAVLALVFLFSRPFLKPAGVAAQTGAAQRSVIILDASLSMRAVQQGVPLFARAQAEAADVLRALEAGSEAAVILIGATPRPLLPALSRNIPALHEELVKTHATFEHGDPAAALALAARMLGGGGTIYVFSDFQLSNWDGIRELPAGVACRLRPVTTEPVDNVALTAMHLAPAEPVVGESSEVICTVFNGTPLPRQEMVRLELADFTQETRVAVPPFGSAGAVFMVTFPTEGNFIGQASLQPDNLPEDNTRHLAVRVHKTLQVLLVSDAEPTDRRSAAFFIQRAFAPSAHSAPGLAVTRRHSQDTDRGILETADVFVLAAPAMLSGEAAQTMERRVQEGARFIAFLDGPTAPFLVPASFAAPFQLRRSVASPNGEPLIPGPRKLFTDADAADWAPLRFRRYYQNQVLEGRVDDVLLFFADGSAALTLTAVGKGAAVFANLPLTPDGGDLIGSPMFPAMLHELLRALRRGAEERAVTPGAAWTLDAWTSGDAPMSVLDPEGGMVEAQVVASGRTTRLALPPARAPGAYLVKQSERIVGTAVVNIDPRESDPRPIALEQLKSGEGAVVSVVRDEDDLLLAGRTRPIWPQVAAAAGGLLALEMLLLAFWRTAPARPVVSAGPSQTASTSTSPGARA